MTHHTDMMQASGERWSTSTGCKRVSSLRCDLGEGLLWDGHTARLLMTDITKGTLMAVNLDSESVSSWSFDEPLAWVLTTTTAEKYVLGLKSGIALFNTQNPEALHWINRDFPGHQRLRLNDACVAAGGLIWYGSMNMLDSSGTDGQLASFSASDQLQIHDQGFGVTNGPVISPDRQFLFFSDTTQATVYRYRMSADSKSLGDRQVFARFDAGQGYPDGMCFDTQGNLWIALWGAASIVQLDPHGRPLQKIAVPALNVTNVCFCGPFLDRLLVSTASIELGPKEKQQFPESGALFEVLNHRSVGAPTFSLRLDSSWT